MINQRIKSHFILMLISLISQPCFAQFDGRLKSKLVDLLFIIVPMVLIGVTFFIADLKRKRKSQSEQDRNISVKNKK
jgi:hypothetical protein